MTSCSSRAVVSRSEVGHPEPAASGDLNGRGVGGTSLANASCCSHQVDTLTNYTLYPKEIE